MDYRRPAQPQPLLWVFFVLFAFAVGVLLERYQLLPGGSPHAPPGVGATFDIFWEAWNLVDAHYVDRQAIQPLPMTRGAIRGMLASLGDVGHTAYVTPERFQELKAKLEGHMVGIGAAMRLTKNVPTVLYVLPDSPARKAGLMAGDILVQVDHKPVTDLSLEAIVNRVRGPEGTTVHLEVLRKGQNKPVEMDVKRAKLNVPETTWHMLPGVPIAHIAIQEFGEKANSQLIQALGEARSQGAKALVIDVRENPGGLKEQAVAVTSEFLKGGNVFLEKDAHGQVKAVPVKPDGHATDIPLAVLIDAGTASSAEIFAGALQDHQRGKLIGTKTAGTGTVLQPFGLSDGSEILLAVMLWLTPDGRQIWHKGIAPDMEVTLPLDAQILLPQIETDLTAAQLAESKDTQLLKAIEVLKSQTK
jgi:carboxyl-terminal processing protease